MSTIAAGAYLERIRKARRYSQRKLADELETSDSQIQRILSGEQDTRGSMWFQIAARIGASAVHLASLLSRDEATRREGEEAADWWLSLTSDQRENYDALMGTDGGRRKLLEAAAALVTDPVLAAQAQGYLDALREQRGR